MAHNQGGLNGIEAINGVQALSTSAVEKILLRNYDSDPTRTTKANNQKFLGLTAQYTTTPFNSTSLDTAFNDGSGTVGMNPFFIPPRTATKIFTA